MNFLSEILTVSQIIALIAAALEIVAVQKEKRKKILFWFVLSDVLFALSYFLLDLKSAGVIVIFDTIVTIINYRLSLKNKKINKWLGSLFILIAFSTSAYTYECIWDILPVICSVTYILSVMQSKEKNIRRLIFINLACWLTYDIHGHAYVTVVTDTFSLISTIVGIIRHDIINVNKGGKKENV